MGNISLENCNYLHKWYRNFLQSTEKNAEAEWAKENIMATPEAVGPSGTGQKPRFPLPKGHSFFLQEAAGTANQSPLLIYLISAKSNSCLHTGGLRCPSLTIHWCVLTAPSWISSRQIPSLICRSKEPCAIIQAGHWQAKQLPESGKKECGEQEVEC